MEIHDFYDFRVAHQDFLFFIYSPCDFYGFHDFNNSDVELNDFHDFPYSLLEF